LYIGQIPFSGLDCRVNTEFKAVNGKIEGKEGLRQKEAKNQMKQEAKRIRVI